MVKQIRKEMRAACLKCSALDTPVQPPPIAPIKNEQESPIPAQSFDPEKLHQAILAYRPV